MDEELTNRFIQFAKRHGYTFQPVHEHSFDVFMNYMEKDKKASFGKLNFVLLDGIGKPYVKELSKEQCEEAFDQLRQTNGRGWDEMMVRGLRGATTVEHDEEQDCS